LGSQYDQYPNRCWSVSESIWLPDPDNSQNSVRRFIFPLLQPLIAPDEPFLENPRSTRKSAIELAFEFQRLLDEGEVNNRAEIAARYGISRARVTQLLNLLRLPQSVLSLLLELGRKAGARFTERQLRPILRLPESAQIATLQQLQEHNREGWRLRTPILLSGG